MDCSAHFCPVSTCVIITGLEWMMVCIHGGGWSVSIFVDMLYLHKKCSQNMFRFKFCVSESQRSRMLLFTSKINAWWLRSILVNDLCTHNRIHWIRQSARIEILVGDSAFYCWFCGQKEDSKIDISANCAVESLIETCNTAILRLVLQNINLRIKT